MTQKEAKNVIDSYKPNDGFFDLSTKPSQMSDVEYAKTLKIQNFLAKQAKQSAYIKKFHPQQWEGIKNLSAQLQDIVFQNWGQEIFNM